jgi:hypothetical protein
MTDPGPAALDAESLRALERGADEFNAGKFFECHDTLEDAWQGMRGPARDFFQGLIQVSVGFYHLRNGNLAGAASQLEKGLEKLERYGPSYAGIELEELRRGVVLWLERIRTGGPLPSTLADLPKYRFAPPPAR